MMDMSETDFLTPGGLNSFSVVALLLKDLPKTTKASGVCKKNFKVKVEADDSCCREYQHQEHLQCRK